MNYFKTQTEAENAFIQDIRLVTTGKDFFKDLDIAFKNWAEGNIVVKEWEVDDRDILEASKGNY